MPTVVVQHAGSRPGTLSATGAAVVERGDGPYSLATTTTAAATTPSPKGGWDVGRAGSIRVCRIAALLFDPGPDVLRPPRRDAA